MSDALLELHKRVADLALEVHAIQGLVSQAIMDERQSFYEHINAVRENDEASAGNPVAVPCAHHDIAPPPYEAHICADDEPPSRPV